MRQGNLYTMVFTIIVSLIAAVILSVSSTVLKQRQELNVELDIKRNILFAVNLMQSGADVERLYRNNIKGIVVNSAGEIVTSNIPPEKIDFEAELEKQPESRRYPLFISSDSKGMVTGYCIPVTGKGLWSTIYGYLALETDLNTVKGITFYKHGETPGLGGEIESLTFKKSFQGKRILTPEGSLVSVSVVKGKIKPNSPNLMHEVDGISGATLTSAGVSRLVKKCLLLYEPYFKKARKNR